MLDRDVALTTIDVLKEVLTRGTARRSLAEFADRRPAFGKTGTQQNNWTAFFVGATRELSTAVMVRDPDRYTPMRGIPEFSSDGVDRVQGGTYPARIWGAYMEDVGLEQFEFADWDPPGTPEREPARLYLPGNECLFAIIGYEPVTTLAEEPPPAPPVEGFAPPRAPPPTTPQPPTATTAPAPTTTSTTAPPRPIFGPVDSGTTIPPDVLDPDAPLPSAPLEQRVRGC